MDPGSSSVAEIQTITPRSQQQQQQEEEEEEEEEKKKEEEEEEEKKKKEEEEEEEEEGDAKYTYAGISEMYTTKTLTVTRNHAAGT